MVLSKFFRTFLTTRKFKFIARAHLDAALPGEFIEMELEQAASNLVHNVMMAAYALRKDAASTTKCWGETGGFMETRLLSEKVIKPI